MRRRQLAALYIFKRQHPRLRSRSGKARLLIEQAEALGESPRRSTAVVLGPYGFRVANFVAFNGDVMRELAAQFLTLAEKQGATAPLLMAHRFVGISRLYTGDRRPALSQRGARRCLTTMARTCNSFLAERG